MRTARLLILAATLCGGTAAADSAVPPLRLCADPANLPFSTSASEGQAAGAPGLYVEIGRTVAEALDRPFETVWSHTYFEKRNLRLTLLAGQCDFAVGLPADRDFMGPRVIFTRPILHVGYALVVPRDKPISGLDDLKGKRVAVQFRSSPQNLLALRNDITAVTTMEPEDGMRRLAAGSVDAAFIWGPTASYMNRTQFGDAFRVVPVDAPNMRWPAAIGFSNKRADLRDAVEAKLEVLAPRFRELAAKYAMAEGPMLTLSDVTRAAAAPSPAAAADTTAVAAPATATTPAATAAATLAPPAAAASATVAAADAAAKVDLASLQGDAAEGRALFNGTCGHCHGPDAVQSVRKINLRLLKHRYGEEMAEKYKVTVTKGRPAKGMPAWESVFNEKDLAKIFAFLSAIQEP